MGGLDGRRFAIAIVLAVACGDSSADGGASGSASGSGSDSADVTGTATSVSTSATSMTSSADSTAGTTSPTTTSASETSATDTGMPTCTLADAWETVDDALVDPDENAKASGVVAAPDGSVYVVGTSETAAGIGRWIARKTDDGGGSWAIVDDFQLAIGQSAAAGDGVVDGDGRVFVTGAASDPTMAVHRLVRRSDDGGASWDTVDDFVFEPGSPSYSSGIAIAPDGTVYTTGQGGSDTGIHWVVRASADGDEWTTSEDYQLTAGHVCLPHGVVVDPDGDAIVVGRCEDADDDSHWLVRRGTIDGGWTMLDDFVYGEMAVSSADVVTIGDRLWVAGAAYSGTEHHWIVKRADLDARDQFSTLDDFGVTDFDVSPTGLVDHGDGTIVAIGTQSGNAEPPHVLTRRSADGGASWAIVDDFAYDKGVYAGDLEADAAGNVWMTAIAFANDGLNHWIVRKLDCE